MLTQCVHAADALTGGDSTAPYFYPTRPAAPPTAAVLQHASTPQARFTLDDGAVRSVARPQVAAARRDRRRRGRVQRGRPGGAAGRRAGGGPGLDNFDANDEYHQIAARPVNSPGISDQEYEREVVHRTIWWSCNP
ncbi:hypothetical protein GCM10023238_28390 [Streptomyces heliomycini]